MVTSCTLLLAMVSLQGIPAIPVPQPPPELSKETVDRLLTRHDKDDVVIKQMYKIGFGRYPTGEELKRMLAFVQMNKGARAKAYEDIRWALTNTKEYMLKHPPRTKPK